MITDVSLDAERLDEIVARSADRARSMTDPASWTGYIESGVLGASMPRSAGGDELPIRALVATLEGLAFGGGDAGVLFAMAAQILSVQHPILLFGTDRQRQAYLSPLLGGQLRGAHAATERESGSDVMRLLTTAIRVSGGYRISGSKTYITNAPDADIALVFASTDPDRREWGITAFLVNLASPGVSRSPNVPKMGLDSAQFGELHFDHCFVSTDDRLGEEGLGSSIFSTSMSLERAFIMAPALGVMRRELERSVDHANARAHRGRTIGRFQSVSNRIADMSVRLELCRLAMYHVAALHDAGCPIRSYAPLVKLVVSEAFLASSLDAIRNKGAAGYLRDDPSATSCRDAIGGLIYSGTSDVLRTLVAAYAGVHDAGYTN
jgi:alkylation response protein AidB-like acyl-CoA dehydrogenase